VIELRDLSIRFASGTEAVRNVNLTVKSGEFQAIVGPSGCGKSTALNAIASLIRDQEATIDGQILVDGVDARRRSPRDLNLGYVFQRDCLLPWRTISGNVQVGLEIRGQSDRTRARRAAQLIDLVGLSGFEEHFPYQVSGGMRQRASLIRTLAYDPQVILMDEPFGALDAQNRMILQAELLKIWERTHNTILFVTHDLGEAIVLAQRVVLFSQRPGTVRRIYDIDLPYPRDPFELRGSPRFGTLETTIWQTLREDFAAARTEARPVARALP
jgi:NitT/TauT family transport system ATP-binding protein